MNKTYDRKGKLISVELDKGEQMILIKENLRRCRAEQNKKMREKGRVPTDK